MKSLTRVIWTLFGVVTLSGITQVAITLRARAPFQNLFVPIDTVLEGALMVVFAFMGILILTRQPGNLIGWLLFLPALIGSVPSRALYPQLQQGASAAPVLLILALWFSNWNWLMLILPILFIPILFPTGRPLTPRWRWPIVAGLLMAVSFLFIATFQAEYSLSDHGLDLSIVNPIGFLNTDAVWNIIQIPWLLGLVSLTLLSFASIFVRYRRSNVVERQQIKWLLYAIGLFAVVYIIGVFTNDLQGLWSDIWTMFLYLAFLGLVASIALAILRYRLWDIDLIIRRTLQYTLMTGFLALIYFGSVLLGQRLAGSLTGSPDSPLVLVVSTLLMAALFNPLRSRVQDFIDRRFLPPQVRRPSDPGSLHPNRPG